MGHSKSIVATLGATLLLCGAVQHPALAARSNLSSKLSSITQMPIGWSVTPTSSGTGVGCLKTVLEPHGIVQTQRVEVDFQNSGGTVGVEEALATFSSAKTAFQKIVTDLNNCKTVKGTSSGHTVKGSVGQMSFPSYANASQAFVVSLTFEGSTYSEDVIVVRASNVVLGLSEFGLTPLSVTRFESLVTKAVVKLDLGG